VKGPCADPRGAHAHKPLDDVDLGIGRQQTSGLTGADLANTLQRGRRSRAAAVAPRASRRGDFDSASERVIAACSRGASSTTTRSGGRLPRGRPRAWSRAAADRRAGPQDLDRPARARARYTLNLPTEDRYLKTRDELIDYMTCCSAAAWPSRSCSARSPPAPPTT
jgi:cell division protease FtsH